jgi:hypothetical protein
MHASVHGRKMGSCVQVLSLAAAGVQSSKFEISCSGELELAPEFYLEVLRHYKGLRDEGAEE